MVDLSDIRLITIGFLLGGLLLAGGLFWFGIRGKKGE